MSEIIIPNVEPVSELAAHCLLCGALIPVSPYDRGPVVCDDCKKAVALAKNMLKSQEDNRSSTCFSCENRAQCSLEGKAYPILGDCADFQLKETAEPVASSVEQGIEDLTDPQCGGPCKGCDEVMLCLCDAAREYRKNTIYHQLNEEEIERACKEYAIRHGVGDRTGKAPSKMDLDPKAKKVADKYHKEHKDDEFANEFSRSYVFSKHQIDLARVWIEEHRKHCPVCKAHRAATKKGVYPLGGWCDFSFDILETDVAALATIKCNGCGAEYYLDEV